MKDVLFTIDDGPSPDTRRLVDFLRARKIPVIMFFIGKNMEKHPAEVDYVIRSGIPIGNHTYTHPEMSKLSLEDCIKEIEKTEEIIEAAYQRNSRLRDHKVLRFPYLDTGGPNRPGLMQYLLENRFEHVQSGFVTHKWFDGYRTEPHIAATFHCQDWELWNNTDKFGTPELLKHLHSADEENLGSLFGGESGEIFVIHEVGWKSKNDQRNYEIIIEELEKAEIHYMKPVFSG